MNPTPLFLVIGCAGIGYTLGGPYAAGGLGLAALILIIVLTVGV
jgi:hypothetical protein